MDIYGPQQFFRDIAPIDWKCYNPGHFELVGAEWSRNWRSDSTGDWKISESDLLDLSYNNFAGEIPPSLKHFALGRNNLNGTIPSSLGKLVNLEVLPLYNNSLTGLIPVSLTSLLNLQALHLGYNSLNGPIPTNMSKMTALKMYTCLTITYQAPFLKTLGGSCST